MTVFVFETESVKFSTPLHLWVQVLQFPPTRGPTRGRPREPEREFRPTPLHLVDSVPEGTKEGDLLFFLKEVGTLFSGREISLTQ